MPSNVRLGVELEGADDGNISVNVDTSFQVLTVQEQGRQAVHVLPAKADQDVFGRAYFVRQAVKIGLPNSGTPK